MSWNFMEPASRENIDRVWRRESEGMLTMAADPAVWEAPTGAGHWQVRDVIGHMVDTTEAYFRSFDAARGKGTVPDPLGLPDMAKYVDQGALELRGVPQSELVERLRADRDRMLGIAAELTDEEWAGLAVPHKYMGPLPAAFYPIFQVVDYTVHSWDIREGSGRSHGMDGEAADLLVPLCFILWQYTCNVAGIEPFTLGIRILSGAHAGDTRAEGSSEGITFTPGSIDGIGNVIEFDPASFVLTAYGRTNGGTYRGDRLILDRFCNLFFRI
ncbi:MAG: maleylpyruvate isomerase family mycothiol-dependent enzyme [Streptosporangiales bacterium]|nr:maleylpyruvate isomerase family mycothiol-dependent enzyme [Streptosporangiales bacterium]